MPFLSTFSQNKLDEALLTSGRVADALSSMLEWLGKVQTSLAEDQPILGDLDTVSMLIEQHKVRSRSNTENVKGTVHVQVKCMQRLGSEAIRTQIQPSKEKQEITRIDVYETLCPQQMLVHKGVKIKNWDGECRDVTPTKSLSQNIRVDVNREVKIL